MEHQGSEPDPYKFTGQRKDETLDIDRFYARDYVGETGRFLSVDPIMEYYNLYTYVGNHPMNFVDPLGMNMHPKGGKDGESDALYSRAYTVNYIWTTYIYGYTDNDGTNYYFVDTDYYGVYKHNPFKSGENLLPPQTRYFIDHYIYLQIQKEKRKEIQQSLIIPVDLDFTRTYSQELIAESSPEILMRERDKKFQKLFDDGEFDPTPKIELCKYYASTVATGSPYSNDLILAFYTWRLNETYDHATAKLNWIYWDKINSDYGHIGVYDRGMNMVYHWYGRSRIESLEKVNDFMISSDFVGPKFYPITSQF